MSNLTKFTPPHPLNTAVLFLVFNRLDTTKQVFEAIREAKPPRLYIAADGARESKNGEDEKVKEVREYILSHIDWDCEVKTLFREQNNGCKMAVSGAIDWFFKNEEMGIILEDDCLPSQSFFWFCEELLERYKDDMRIWHIGGNNFNYLIVEQKNDFGFIRYGQVWGWATWQNRWKEYDANLKNFEQDFSGNEALKTTLNLTTSEVSNIKNRFYRAKLGDIDTWDYQWHATIIINNGLCIVPFRNLIKNIGNGPDATHTVNDQCRTHLPIYNLSFPVKLCKNFLISYELEEFMKKRMSIKTSILKKIIKRLIK